MAKLKLEKRGHTHLPHRVHPLLEEYMPKDHHNRLKVVKSGHIVDIPDGRFEGMDPKAYLRGCGLTVTVIGDPPAAPPAPPAAPPAQAQAPEGQDVSDQD